jgi:hypothetical protein
LSISWWLALLDAPGRRKERRPRGLGQPEELTRMNAIALPAFDHPTWCDARYCDAGTGDPIHARRLHRWVSCDVEITVSITAGDEWYPSEQRVIHHEPMAKVVLEDIASGRVSRSGHVVEIVADVELTAADCRRLAEQLLDAARRVDAAGAAR